MPCYINEAYVSQAIQSILKQSYPHWELLLVDDASTDKSREIIQEQFLKDKKNKIFYPTDPNKGLYKLETKP